MTNRWESKSGSKVSGEGKKKAEGVTRRNKGGRLKELRA